MIERSRDYMDIRRLMTQPEIFRHISDDHHADPTTWKPIATDFVIYLIARDNEIGAYGFGAFVPRNRSCYESHIGFLPLSYGAKAIESFRSMIGWMWTYTKAARLVGEVAVENRLALRFAKLAGFSEYGINQKSWLKDGILRDRVCLGISRPGA